MPEYVFPVLLPIKVNVLFSTSLLDGFGPYNVTLLIVPESALDEDGIMPISSPHFNIFSCIG